VLDRHDAGAALHKAVYRHAIPIPGSESWRESDDGKAIAQHAGGQHGGLGHNTQERLFAAVTALCRCGATKYAGHSILSLFAR
jgi:hypothetical protein